MAIELERQLAEFVNRDDEMEIFREVLEADDKPIMVVYGEGGVGKSWLLARMIHECAIRKLRKSEVIWTDTRNHDYLAIMRKIRDDLEVDYFKSFTDLVNYFTVPKYELQIRTDSIGSVSVASSAQIENSSINDIAGIVIKDLMLIMPRSDMAVPETERMARLTDTFIDNLAVMLKTGPMLVVFFDAVEKMTENTRKWVWGELLRSLSGGRLNNIKFVLCGREEPSLDRDLQVIVEETKLMPLALENIIDYLAKRGVGESSRRDLAAMLLVMTKGNPLQIATLVDGFLKMQTKKLRTYG